MTYLLLFIVAVAGGLLAFTNSKPGSGLYKLALVFAGSYLFSVTVIHILPELFHASENHTLVGIFVLCGFFLQQILEFMSKGVEHGHVHVHEKGHRHLASTAIWALIALSLHALLEGGLLTNIDSSHNANTLLIGILIHKAPEAFALVSVLVCELSRPKAIVALMIFALASPIGLLTGEALKSSQMLSNVFFTSLFALVSGNFLHISTTIVYESSSNHQFNSKKMLTAIVAAAVAILSEVFF